MIERNRYGGKFEKLKWFGVEDKVKEIEQAGVEIGKRGGNEERIIVGRVGGLRGVGEEDMSV
ncbi:hypothetical protein [Staphylococcus epidermidis]|uniref:hypothetical protein n=1 Tax=Staphylococcus epidermidis TaxID=1282 RepID=UPI0011A80EB6|nr:hypothetical protein [Staphylococcus epidermidis]